MFLYRKKRKRWHAKSDNYREGDDGDRLYVLKMKVIKYNLISAEALYGDSSMCPVHERSLGAETHSGPDSLLSRRPNSIVSQ